MFKPNLWQRFWMFTNDFIGRGSFVGAVVLALIVLFMVVPIEGGDGISAWWFLTTLIVWPGVPMFSWCVMSRYMIAENMWNGISSSMKAQFRNGKLFQVGTKIWGRKDVVLEIAPFDVASAGEITFECPLIYPRGYTTLSIISRIIIFCGNPKEFPWQEIYGRLPWCESKRSDVHLLYWVSLKDFYSGLLQAAWKSELPKFEQDLNDFINLKISAVPLLDKILSTMELPTMFGWKTQLRLGSPGISACKGETCGTKED